MREQFGNIWDMRGDAICITTNLSMKKNGEAIMGGGIARECRERHPLIPRLLGQKFYDKQFGVSVLGDDQGRLLIHYPTKDNVWEPSKLPLIIKSSNELLSLVDWLDLTNVLVPRPGCGLGGLRWEDVRPELDKIFDDRFIIVGYAKEA